jgi:hyperosmotically inducible protein
LKVNSRYVRLRTEICKARHYGHHSFSNRKGNTMKNKLATVCVIGTLLFPVAGYTADAGKDGSQAKTFVKDSVITTKIKSKLAAEHLSSLKDIKVDTDLDGVVWMSGTASSQAEADKAVAIAHGTEGVKSVKNQITVKSH